MSLRDQSTLRIVLYEGEGAELLEPSERFATMSALLEKGFAVTRTGGAGRVAPADVSPLLVLGKFAEGISEFDAAGKQFETLGHFIAARFRTGQCGLRQRILV